MAKFITFFSFFVCFSQNIEIEYLEKLNFSSGMLLEPFIKKSTLILNNTESIYKSFLINYQNSEASDSRGKTVSISGQNDTTYVYKNHLNKIILCKKSFFSSDRIVSEKFDIIPWYLKNESKVILGYECYKATTNYRGRTFEVFYTTKIPISEGPLHFNGLPGVILYMKMIDEKDTFEIEAVSIKNTNNIITNPLSNSKILSFEEYKAAYKKKREELWAYGNNIGQNKISKGSFEILVDED